MSDINQTQFFKVNVEPELRVKEVLDTVYNAMREKGYNPVNQIVGYIMSGDPTYITSHNGASAACGTIPRTSGRSWSRSCATWSGPPPMRRS